MSSGRANPMTDLIAYLRTPAAIREQSARVLKHVEDGQSHWFALSGDGLEAAVQATLAVTRERFPNPAAIPFHSRWRHFEAGGRDRWSALAERLKGLPPEEIARRRMDLAVVSVLLDAGAGTAWSYREPRTGETYARSEGLGIASLHMFANGAFSRDAKGDPLRVDAERLAALAPMDIAMGFQVKAHNPLLGLEGRAELLRKLGNTGLDRPGALFDIVAGSGDVKAEAILAAILDRLSPIWPTKLGDVWDDGRRDAVRRRFEAAGAAWATDGYDHVARKLDPYAEQWLAMQTQACRDEVEGARPQAVLALQMTCLERRRDALAALGELLASGDAATLERAIDAADNLPALDVCGDLERLMAREGSVDATVDPETRRSLDAALARAKVLIDASALAAARTEATALIERTKSAGYARGEAFARHLVAVAYDLGGETESAERSYHEALSASLASGDAEVVVRASIGLLWVMHRLVTRRLSTLVHNLRGLKIDDPQARLAMVTNGDGSGDEVVVLTEALNHFLDVRATETQRRQAAEQQLRSGLQERSAILGSLDIVFGEVDR